VPVLTRDQINNSVIIAIGSYKNNMSEIDRKLMCQAESIIVDSKEQALNESGEISELLNSGCRRIDEVQSLSNLFHYGNMKKLNGSGIIIFKSVVWRQKTWQQPHLYIRE